MMTDEVKQALDMLRRNLSANKEGIAALATVRHALEQSESQLRAISSRLKASEIEQEQSWSRANEAEAEQEKLLAYAKTIQPGAHSVYEVLDRLRDVEQRFKRGMTNEVTKGQITYGTIQTETRSTGADAERRPGTASKAASQDAVASVEAEAKEGSVVDE